MMDTRKFPITNKLWGHEVELVNNESYCAKFLVLKPGYQCSLHCHKVKKETFIVYEGVVELEVLDLEGYKSVNRLEEGDSYTLEPQYYHRFSTPAGATILEISTPHSDSDVYRLVDSRKLND